MRRKVTLYCKLFTLIILFFSSFQSFSSIIYGQSGGVGPGETISTNPKTRDNTVSATVPDIISPTAPFLISPEDEALINDATPNFIWQESSDNVGVDHYELYIDGTLAYGSIPTTATTTSEYTLTYNSGSGQFTLTPTNLLADGHHTWYVMVYDAAGNYNTSATWDFYIDTQSPAFIIQTIGPIDTNISAQDIGSVPDDPIELEDNEPLFSGTGEANASVQVTIEIPGESNQVINFVIAPDGTWNFQLGILPRDEVITLTFVITDPSGNVSVITDLQILIILDVIIIPPTPPISPTSIPSPLPSPGETPFPDESPSVPGVTPPPTPISTPFIVIPILPPKEVAEIVKDSILDLIPDPILEIITLIPQEIRQTIKLATNAIAPAGVLIATATVPVLSFLTLLLQLGKQFSWDIIIKILQALGLLPPKEPQGMVFDSQTNQPVSFALLTINSVDKTLTEPINETAVTDVDGIYQGITLPIGKYTIVVSHQDYNFPTQKKRPNYYSIQEFYKGEIFEVHSEKRQQLFLIPMDKKVQIEYKSTLEKIFRSLLRKIKFTDLFWPLFGISVLIALFYPTWINLLVLALYCLVLFKRLIKSFEKPAISGFVTTTNQEPVENAIIRVSDPNRGELVSIVHTDKTGYHKSFLKPKKYQIQVTKSGLYWDRQNALSFNEIDVTKERKTLNAIMRDITEIYAQLFGELESTQTTPSNNEQKEL